MHKVQKQTDINGILTKLQKPTTFFLFGVMILMFVYSLIFITPFYKNIYKTDGEMLTADLNKYGINIEDYDSSIWTLKDSTNKGSCILVKEKDTVTAILEAGYPAAYVENYDQGIKVVVYKEDATKLDAATVMALVIDEFGFDLMPEVSFYS
jgi:hypothetical protein